LAGLTRLARLSGLTRLAGLSRPSRLARLRLGARLPRPPLLFAIELNRLAALLIATAAPLVIRWTPLGLRRVLRRKLPFLVRHDNGSFPCVATQVAGHEGAIGVPLNDMK
jgi:hypothetical protein